MPCCPFCCCHVTEPSARVQVSAALPSVPFLMRTDSGVTSLARIRSRDGVERSPLSGRGILDRQGSFHTARAREARGADGAVALAPRHRGGFVLLGAAACAKNSRARADCEYN